MFTIHQGLASAKGETEYTVMSALPIERKFLSPIVRALISKIVGVTGYTFHVR